MGDLIKTVSSEFVTAPLGARRVNDLIKEGGCDWFHLHADRVTSVLNGSYFLSVRADIAYLFHYVLVEDDAPRDAVLAELERREFVVSGPFELLLFWAAHHSTQLSYSLTTLDNEVFATDPVLKDWFLTMHYCPMGYVVGGVAWGKSGYRLAFQPRFNRLMGTQAILVHRPVRP